MSDSRPVDAESVGKAPLDGCDSPDSSSGIGEIDDLRPKCRAAFDNGGGCGGASPAVFLGGPDIGESDDEGVEVESETEDQRDRSSFVTAMLGATSESLGWVADDEEFLLGGTGCENDRRAGGRKWCSSGVIPSPTDGDDVSGRGGRGGAVPPGERPR